MPVKEKARKSHKPHHPHKVAHTASETHQAHGRGVKPQRVEDEELPHKNRISHLIEDQQPQRSHALVPPAHLPAKVVPDAEASEVLGGDETENEPTPEE